MKRLLLPLLLLVASPLFAICTSTGLEFVPARPGPADVVAIRVSGGCSDGCTPQVRSVRVDGRTIRLESSTLGTACILVPTPYSFTYSLGPLAIGTWDVGFVHDGAELARGTLTVVATKEAFEVLPSFGRQGTEVFLRGVPGCPGPACASKGVRFNGVEATALRATNDGLFATVPALAEGPVDVAVVSPDGLLLTSPAAFRYTTRFDASHYARVLFPVAYSGPGAGGASWTSENLVGNGGPVPVATIPSIWLPSGVPAAASAIPPRSMATMPSQSADVGALLLVPRELMQFVDFASHIRDTSRIAENLGTEIPVVTEEETATLVRIVGIPNDARYRPRLRIYDIDGDERPITVEAVTSAGFRSVYSMVLLRRSFVCVTTPCEDAAYGAFDLTGIPPGGLIEVTVRGGTEGRRLWAFVSLTNNQTQQVTTYTPQ